MPKNELKNRVRFSTTLEIGTDKRLKEFSQKTEIPVSRIVNNAINEYIESRDKAENIQQVFNVQKQKGEI